MTTLHDARIQGRTEALEFIAPLIKKWEKDAEKTAYDIAVDVLNQCAEELETKIEEFAST